MPVFPKEFVESTRAVFGGRAQVVLDALCDEESVTAVRANPSKLSPEALKSRFDASEPVPWRNDAFYLKTRPVFSTDPLLHAGAYYVQDPAAMFVGSVADAVITRENRPLKLLDLCAAPGGKSTCLAASLSPGSLLVANEVIGSRATILAENMVKWGSAHAVVTNNDPKDFSRLPGFFDILLADVPCSGEGMFRKEQEAIAEWSVDNVRLCAARQRRIIADAWDSLREGGWLIYSTCTFNREENDLNVEWICGELGAEVMPIDNPGAFATHHGLQFAPGITRGEGQYVALMRKTTPSPKQVAVKPFRSLRKATSECLVPGMDCFYADTSAGTLIKGYPHSIVSDIHFLEDKLRVLRSGVAVALVKGHDLVPQADLALSQALKKEALPAVELTNEQALQYLRCEALYLPDAPKGFVLVTYEQLPIGFVKNLGSRANNLFPQAWRLRKQ